MQKFPEILGRSDHHNFSMTPDHHAMPEKSEVLKFPGKFWRTRTVGRLTSRSPGEIQTGKVLQINDLYLTLDDCYRHSSSSFVSCE